MLHGHGQVLFNRAATDPHLSCNFNLSQSLKAVQFQSRLRSYRKGFNRLSQNSNFLIFRNRIVYRNRWVWPVFKYNALFAISLGPLPITGHSSPSTTQLIKHKVVGHAEKIGTTICDRT